jgi:class 3 adenylate cyclase
MAGVADGAPPPASVLPPLVDRRQWYVYGPIAPLRQVFRYIGHISYHGFGTLAPMVRLTDTAAISHMTLYLAKERRFEAGKLILDGATVPIDGRGEITINFVPPKAFEKANMSILGLLSRAKNGQQSKLIRKDDVVLILPLMFTGNADFTETPFGAVPGGQVIASMLNSVLTGTWLKPLAGGEALVVLLAFVGALLGMKAGVVSFWVGLVGTVLALLGLSEYLFAWHGIVVPWLFPLASFVGAGVTVFAEKTRAGEKKVAALRSALEGSVAPGELKSILKRPELISFEARERVVTLMFIDVVGFSLLAENMLPRMAFENLKRMLSTIGDTIHGFGGIIDKTLGDGLLCYFGYRFDEDSSSPDHAEKALHCAIKIQRENLMRNLEAAENGEPVYPLRIGINTASCYLGDLGSQNRIDFTVVGNGVNFAKRLEGACEMHSVLIGATTNDLVKGIDLPKAAIQKRFIRIKHHSELVEAYEYDPFCEEPELRMAALEGFRKCANIERVDQRWPVHDPSKIQVRCDFGDAVLVNFSHSGFSLKLKQLLTRGTRLNITLDAASGALKDLLAKEAIGVLQGEVRWGYAEGAEFVHGVLITNITEKQSDAIVQYLCEFAFSRGVRDKDGEEVRDKAS